MRTSLLLFLAACTNGPVTAVTYNVGLAVGFVDGARERPDGAAEQVAALDADLVCLEEVWLPDQVDAFEVAAEEAFPFRQFADPEPDDREAPACAAGDLDDVVGCADRQCADVCLDGLADCLLSSCALDLLALPTDCQRCSFAQIGNEIDDIVQTCTTEDTRFGYDGSFGIGLMSRGKLRDAEQKTFDSAVLRRGALHAVAATPAGDVDVYCTHLASDLAPLPYTEAEGSWAEENEAQVEALLDWVDQTATTGRVVVLGDMNTGPAGGDFEAELPDSWAKLAAGGLADPYVEQIGTCTMCAANPLRGEGSHEMLIDHVLLDGFDGEPTAERILEDTFTLDTCEGTIDSAWSDHYGVSVTIAP